MAKQPPQVLVEGWQPRWQLGVNGQGSLEAGAEHEAVVIAWHVEPGGALPKNVNN